MSTDGAAPSRHRVVVVGGGFAGLFAARRLSRCDVDVTLVDRSANHVFQPMLYQVATGLVPVATIAPPLRSIFQRRRNVHVLLAEVTGFDLERRIVHARSPDAELTLGYDSLIVASGMQTSYFGHDEYARHAPGLKTVDDAVAVGQRLFGAFEAAEATDDPEARQAWLTFAVIGAGPTGIELSGQIRQAATHTLKREYRSIGGAMRRTRRHVCSTRFRSRACFCTSPSTSMRPGAPSRAPGEQGFYWERTPASATADAYCYAVAPTGRLATPCAWPGPHIVSFTPGQGDQGYLVTVYGAGFTGASALTFNGVGATYAVTSDATIVTSVPDGVTAGPVRVVTPRGTAISPAPFTAYGRPTSKPSG